MEQAMNTQLKPAFGYIRVSGESQVKEDGPVRQRQAIATYAKANGFRIVKWFTEEAVSGTVESKDRPAFADMLAALMSNGTRTVLIEKLDRIAREVYVQEGTIRLLKAKGFELISVCEPDLNSDDMYRVAMRQMMGVFAELDRKSIVYKLRAARQRKRDRDGYCEGRKAFGARAGEDAIIARMKELRATGATWDSIASTLNVEGLKPRQGKAWYATSVRRVVTAQ
jgi:DNA invertase Pin-like site-specific DNA recombinase